MGQAQRKIQRRKKELQRLAKLMSQPENVVIIHYSCESFYNRPHGASPRITSIAVQNLESAQTASFAMHQAAEKNGYPLDKIEPHYDELEKQMLDEFYDYVSTHSGRIWLHWNMRNINYGFQAIAHRHGVLQGEPVKIDESNLVDLSRLDAIYGIDYIEHPYLQRLMEKNNITDKDFLSGADEAKAFEEKEYGKLHFSTLRKVRVLASFARRADERILQTNSTWKDIYGSYPQFLNEWVQEHWITSLIGAILALLGFLITLVQGCR